METQLLKASIVTVFTVNFICIMICRCVDKPAYWPSISEAGAGRAYPLYSLGGIICSILIFSTLCVYSF